MAVGETQLQATKNNNDSGRIQLERNPSVIGVALADEFIGKCFLTGPDAEGNEEE